MTLDEVYKRTDPTTFWVFYGCLLMGPVQQSHRRLAMSLGVARSTMHIALESLVKIGAVQVEQGEDGIKVVLLAVDARQESGRLSTTATDTGRLSTVTEPSRQESGRLSTTPLVEEFSLTSPDATPPDKTKLLDESFAKFWAVYWRKDKKKAAREAWPKAVIQAIKQTNLKGTAASNFIIGKLTAQRQLVEDGTAPSGLAGSLPASWLNEERWNDETKPTNNGASRLTVQEQALARAVAKSNEKGHY